MYIGFPHTILFFWLLLSAFCPALQYLLEKWRCVLYTEFKVWAHHRFVRTLQCWASYSYSQFLHTQWLKQTEPHDSSSSCVLSGLTPWVEKGSGGFVCFNPCVGDLRSFSNKKHNMGRSWESNGSKRVKLYSNCELETCNKAQRSVLFLASSTCAQKQNNEKDNQQLCKSSTSDP